MSGNQNVVMTNETGSSNPNTANAEEMMFGQKTAMTSTARTPYGRQVAAFQKGAASLVAGSPTK